MVVTHFPETVLIAAVFRAGESKTMKTFLIIRPMTPFNRAILPRRTRLDCPMANAKSVSSLLKSCPAFRMSRISHRKGHRVIRHDEKTGGNRSQACCHTSATVSEVKSGWISEYFRRVPQWMTEMLSSKPVSPSMAGTC